MPYFRITLKLKKEPRQVSVTEFPNKDIDFVYHVFETRVNEKYGAGQVEYFNCVMVAKKTLGHPLPERNKYIDVPQDKLDADEPGMVSAKKKNYDTLP